MKPIELEVYDFEEVFKNIGLSDDEESIALHVRDAKIKTMLFLSIDAIAPEKEDDGTEFTSVFVGGDFFSCIYSYGVLKDILTEHCKL